MKTIEIKRVLLDQSEGIDSLAACVLRDLSKVQSSEHAALILSRITGCAALNYVAYDQANAVGFMSMHAAYGQAESSVDYLYVDAQNRGRRIGKQLLAVAIQKAQSCGASNLWLSPLDESLVAYYERNGFLARRTQDILYMERPVLGTEIARNF